MNIWNTSVGTLPRFRTEIKFNHIVRKHQGLFLFMIILLLSLMKLFHFKGSWADRNVGRQRKLHSHTSLKLIRHSLLGNRRPWLVGARFDYWIETKIRTSDAPLCTYDVGYELLSCSLLWTYGGLIKIGWGCWRCPGLKFHERI